MRGHVVVAVGQYRQLEWPTETAHGRGKHRSPLRPFRGATSPAEFFAEATVAFFEKGRSLQRKRPELYEELKSYYRQDPAEW